MVGHAGIHGESAHIAGGVLGFAIDGDGAGQAVKQDFDEGFGFAGDPLRFVERRAEVWHARTVGTVATEAGGYTVIQGFAALEGGEIGSFQAGGALGGVLAL